MPQIIPILQKDNFSGIYFNQDNRVPHAAPSGHLEVIKTGDHFKSCQHAASPHLLDFYMLCLISKGEGVYHFGADSFYLKENTLCFIQPYTLTSWHSQTAVQEGFCCTFSADFFNQGMENKSWLKDLPFHGQLVVSLTREEMAYFHLVLEDMERGYAGSGLRDTELLRSQLHVLVRKAATLLPDKSNHILPHNSTAVNMVKSFLQFCKTDLDDLIAGKINALPLLKQYADRLHVSPNHMNDTIRSVLGKSAGQCIQEQLAAVASGLLKQSDLTISQVADRLGFNNASYFARFYKTQTGLSPSGFRKQHP